MQSAAVNWSLFYTTISALCVGYGRNVNLGSARRRLCRALVWSGSERRSSARMCWKVERELRYRVQGGLGRMGLFFSFPLFFFSSQVVTMGFFFSFWFGSFFFPSILFFFSVTFIVDRLYDLGHGELSPLFLLSFFLLCTAVAVINESDDHLRIKVLLCISVDRGQL